MLTGSPIGAVASAVAKKQMERRGSLLSAAALRALSESSALKGAGKALQQRFSTIRSIAPEVLGAYRFPLAQAAAIGADALLEEHLKLASGPTGADYMAKMALPAESPEEVDGVGKKIAFDTSKPEGQPRRHCDTTLLEERFDFRAQVPLEEGLRQTVEYYRGIREPAAA